MGNIKGRFEYPVQVLRKDKKKVEKKIQFYKDLIAEGIGATDLNKMMLRRYEDDYKILLSAINILNAKS